MQCISKCMETAAWVVCKKFSFLLTLCRELLHSINGVKYVFIAVKLDYLCILHAVSLAIHSAGLR